MSQPALVSGTLPLNTDIPAEVRQGLDELRQKLVQAAGDRLAALVLYGGLARGRYRPGRSDVNLLLLLRDASPASLDPLLAALRQGMRTSRVEPMILPLADLPAAFDAFPAKFVDIQDHHLLLAGQDPLTGLRVSPDRLRVAAGQSLRNLSMRMRRRYVAVGGDEPAMAKALAEFARPVAIDLQCLLRVSNVPLPPEDHTVDIFAAAAKAFGLDAEALARVAALRKDTASASQMAELYARFLVVIDRAATLASEPAR